MDDINTPELLQGREPSVPISTEDVALGVHGNNLVNSSDPASD